mgnify:CR=1 FL=1
MFIKLSFALFILALVVYRINHYMTTEDISLYNISCVLAIVLVLLVVLIGRCMR